MAETLAERPRGSFSVLSHPPSPSSVQFSSANRFSSVQFSQLPPSSVQFSAVNFHPTESFLRPAADRPARIGSGARGPRQADGRPLGTDCRARHMVGDPGKHVPVQFSSVNSHPGSRALPVQFSSANSHPAEPFLRPAADRLTRASACRGHTPPMDRRCIAGLPRWTSGGATNSRRSRTWENPPGKDPPVDPPHRRFRITAVQFSSVSSHPAESFLRPAAVGQR